MSFNIALTGLNAATQDLSVTSNNLANSQTIGFKESRTEFGDIFASSQTGVASTAVGNGVQVTEVAQQFTQGNIETTGNSLDLAISGNGFFTVSNNGSLQYTRDGEFQLNSQGQVVTATGAALQVYAPLANGTFNTGGLSSISLTTNESLPSATTTASITATLPASASAPTNATFSPSDPTSYTNTTSLTVYDSLGAAHTESMYFIKGSTANQWSVATYIDGNEVGTPQALTYSSAGLLTSPAGGKISLPAYTPSTGAAAMNITLDLSGTQQTGSAFAVTAVNQDGYTTGTLTGISIDSSGVVQATFTNGRTTNLGQVALANFANPQGLQQLGNATYAQTNASGSPVMGVAGGANFGSLESGSLEESNVDTTSALVQMITAQRNFQANAQMIQTDDQITQTVINIRGG
ncbi:MAG TPA: flagellar hook protein FlgE [Steroidobacteraceae bacterium]|nr:flagellar hook protein FlgE [Steroidobacteraceae bacterium]